jgi:hypothetical protein
MSKDGGVFLFDSRIDTGVAKELDDGSAKIDVKLAPVGEKTQENAGREFKIGTAEVKQAIANFKTRGGPVPVTIGHFPEKERQHQPAAAWLETLFVQRENGETFLKGTMRFLKDTWQKVKTDQFKFLSLEIWPDDTDQEGKNIGLNIDGVAILNYPFYPLRIDQSSSHEGAQPLISLSRFAMATRRPSMKTKKKGINLQDEGLGIREVDGEFCIFDGDGVNRGCHGDREQAEAALAELMTGDPTGGVALNDIREVEGEGFCLFGEDGTKLKCYATREEAEAAIVPSGGGEGDAVAVKKTHLAKLQKDSKELQQLRKKGSSTMTSLQKDVAQLKGDKLALRLQKAITKLREVHKVAIPLGDHDIETAEGALAFVKSGTFGVTSIEGWEKLSDDMASSAHLPRISMGKLTSTGSGGTEQGDPELNTEEGRAEMVRRRTAQLRKQYSEENLRFVLGKRNQNLEEYAKQELRIEHPNVKW